MLTLRAEMKVVLMSGYEVSGLRGAGWPFLQKHFAVEPLKRMVAAALRGYPKKR